MNIHRLADLAEMIDADLIGNDNTEIHGIASIHRAKPGDITYMDNPQYYKHLENTNASAVILSSQHAEQCPVAALIVPNPNYAYARVAELFSNPPAVTPGIHPSAVIHPEASIDETASIGANVVVEKNAFIEAGVVIGAGCYIGEDVKIAVDTHLWPNVTVNYGVEIGERAEVYSGVVIGADGFGLVKHEAHWTKVPQLGGVLIGDDVAIGANTTIDRGALENTIIGNDVKIDNLVQIAHNVVIGDHTAIAGCVGIAGSAKIGAHCLIGGGCGIVGHIEIVDNVSLVGRTTVAQSITQAGVYSSGIPAFEHRKWAKNVLRLRQLDQMAKTIKSLEKQVQQLQQQGTQ